MAFGFGVLESDVALDVPDFESGLQVLWMQNQSLRREWMMEVVVVAVVAAAAVSAVSLHRAPVPSAWKQQFCVGSQTHEWFCWH